MSHHHPLHITLRIAAGVPSLRDGRLFETVRRALAAGRERFGFRLVHFSVQSNHLHLIAEAQDRRALALGMQGLSVRLARAVNRTLARRGRLFADRYHARALKTPRAAHFAIRYVLLNARKHGAAVAPGFIDRCSSAAWFGDFSRPDELAFGAAQTRAQWRAASGLDAPVVPPETWLLRYGCGRHGGFDIDDEPAERRASKCRRLAQREILAPPSVRSAPSPQTPPCANALTTDVTHTDRATGLADVGRRSSVTPLQRQTPELMIKMLHLQS